VESIFGILETREMLDYYFGCYTRPGRVADTFGEELPEIHGGEILDVGCAAGRTTAEIAQLYPSARVTGIDLDRYSIGLALENAWENHLQLLCEGRLEFMIADGYHLGRYLPGRTFDAIFMMNNLYFRAHELDDSRLREILGQAKQRLNHDGYLLLSGNRNYLILQETARGTRLRNRFLKRGTRNEHRRGMDTLVRCALG